MIKRLIFQRNDSKYTVKVYFLGILIFKETKYPVFQE